MKQLEKRKQELEETIQFRKDRIYLLNTEMPRIRKNE